MLRCIVPPRLPPRTQATTELRAACDSERRACVGSSACAARLTALLAGLPDEPQADEDAVAALGLSAPQAGDDKVYAVLKSCVARAGGTGRWVASSASCALAPCQNGGSCADVCAFASVAGVGGSAVHVGTSTNEAQCAAAVRGSYQGANGARYVPSSQQCYALVAISSLGPASSGTRACAFAFNCNCASGWAGVPLLPSPPWPPPTTHAAAAAAAAAARVREASIRSGRAASIHAVARGERGAVWRAQV